MSKLSNHAPQHNGAIPRVIPQRNFRLQTISILAVVIGLGAGFLAFVLYPLIAFFSNLFFFQRVSFDLPNLQDNHLGILVIVLTTLGGLVLGWMAKYGSEKIRGHGIPEAMEAVLINHS